MNDDGVVLVSKLLGAVPHLLYKRTRRVVLLYFKSLVEEAMFNFDSGSERGYDHDVVGREIVPRNKLRPVSVHDKTDTAAHQIVIYLLVVYHLTEQKNPFSAILFQRTIADFNGIFHSVAEPEMAGEVKPYGPKVENRGGKVLFSQVLNAT